MLFFLDHGYWLWNVLADRVSNLQLLRKRWDTTRVALFWRENGIPSRLPRDPVIHSQENIRNVYHKCPVLKW